ncbi:MAG: hypothetical protein J0L82_08815 [Deltaproteobacteria bacterium]|jgi:hypothetical protein|nr:hypothetical protein [Deltaproteobacteria bacterium]
MSRHQILVFIGFVMSLGLIAQNASAQAVVFDCQKRMDISGDPAAPEWIEFGITVVEKAGTFVSTLKGATDPSPRSTVFQNLSLADGLQVGGVSSVLDVANLDPVQRAAVQKVKVYTTGNFDDDAAGVRAIEYSDVNGLAIAKGMFFGWAGPHICD